jgi:hypothetical protein
MTSIRRTATTIFALALVLSGCAEHDLAPVSGVVLLDREPLVRGVVNFRPIHGEADNPGPESTGITDEEGRFELRTLDGDVGAVVGKHSVRITSRTAEAPAEQGADPRATVELVPARYNLQTKLTFSVPAEGTDKADFLLESD